MEQIGSAANLFRIQVSLDMTTGISIFLCIQKLVLQTFSQEPGFVSDQWFLRTPSPSPGHYKETFELVKNIRRISWYFEKCVNSQGGHTVSNTALTWKPWLDIYDCQGPEGAEKKYTGCRGRGILVKHC